MTSKNKGDKAIKVAELKSGEAGRGIVRLDPELMDVMDIKVGDIVKITGEKSTVAKVLRGGPEDANRGIVRIDGNTRWNAGTSIDERVAVQKVNAKPATKITFAPTDQLRLQGGDEYFKQVFEGRAFSKGDAVALNVMGNRMEFVVTSYAPSSEAVILTSTTDVKISDKPADVAAGDIPQVSYDDIGGLDDAVSKIREMVELPLKHPELFDRLGIEAPMGVLLHGPPGTGKTMLAKAVAGETSSNFIYVGGPEIMSKYYGESEEKLRDIFTEAEENAPSIIFIDEIDSIAPKRDEVTGETERRIVAQLLALMDGIKSRGKVVVIGATNRPNSIDEALRRPGRFDREIEIGIPDRDGRFDILEIHTRGMPIDESVKLETIADKTHGYSGADISALTKEAAMAALRRVLPDIDTESGEVPLAVLNSITITMDDFREGFKDMQPSTMREVLIERPNVKWNDIGALQSVKDELKEAVEWPLKYSKVFEHMGAKPPKGILLYGPPGTGKTLLAKAVATESEANFISVKGPEFLNKWVGESEKAVRETFRKARQAAPCVIFMDEIDSIAPNRGSGSCDSNVTERVVSQLLTEMDGLEVLNDVVIIAATNRPDMIDPALLRPGRFDKSMMVGPPDEESRVEIFKIHTRGKPLEDGVDLKKLAEITEGCTGADISAIANEAVMTSVRRLVAEGDPTQEELDACKVTMEDFEKAAEKFGPAVSKKLKEYGDRNKE